MINNYANLEDMMFTHTTTTQPVATLDEIRIALTNVNEMLVENAVKDPMVASKMFETLFPYVLNAVMHYHDEEDAE